MKPLLFAVFLAVVQTPPPVPLKATDSPANTPHNSRSQASANKPKASASTPLPPANVIDSINNENSGDTVRSKDQPGTVRITELPPVGVSRDWADWVLWGFNGLLVFAGFAGIWYARKTLKTIKEQTAATRIAADAAKESAEAASLNAQVLINTERAWLIPCASVTPKTLPTFQFQPNHIQWLTIQIQNFGRTPAWLTDWFFEAVVLETTDIRELINSQRPEADHPNARPLPPAKVEDFRVKWEIHDSSEINDIQSGKKHLYVYGYLQYRSTVGRDLCCSYFCFHHFHRRDNDGSSEDGWTMEPPEGNHYT
jgi:hypothetical protein